MVLLAFSLQDQVEKYGAYVGIAAFFGLAVLSLLYFAQAREVKRLREWAGRAPERAAELEQLALERAEEARRAAAPQPAAQPQPQPVAQPAAAAAANGAVKLQPAEVAALAFARAAGVHDPHVPRPHPAPVPAATVAAPAAPSKTADVEPEEATGVAAVAASEPALAQATNGGGSGTAPPKPPPATPAARRPEPAPLPPRRPAPAPRRTTPPPRRESNTRSIVITAIVGVLVLAGTAFVVTSLLGGEEPEQPAPPVATVPPEEAEATATAEPVTKEDALVMVYNGTSITGLAGQYETQLQEEGYPDANIEVATLAEAEQRQTSVVMYRNASSRRAAQGVASTLGIEQVERLDAATQTSLKSLPDAQQKDYNVVVIVGVDKSTS
ncbi:MAG TPA: LytR C-terminal domain-containing protein [Solirubrobacter sp.]|nr:LytR C-terminal domain-containing protein [Solirubrobacter sp.]